MNYDWKNIANQCRNELYNTNPLRHLRYTQQLGFCDFGYPYEDETGRIRINFPAIEHANKCYEMFMDWLSFRFRPTQTLDTRLLETLFAMYLHDVGKGHASHILEKLNGYNHEERGREIILSNEISSILEKHELDPKRIGMIVCGELPPYSDALVGDIGFDRRTYSAYDTQKKFEATGNPNIEQIWSTFRTLSERLNLTGDEFYAENLNGSVEVLIMAFLLNRAYLIYEVYGHPANRSASNMYRRCVEVALEKEIMSMNQILTLTFPQQYNQFKKITEEPIQKIFRNLHRGVPFYGIEVRPKNEELSQIQRMKDNEDRRLTVENELSKRLKSMALVDINPLPKESDLNFRIKEADGFHRASEEIYLFKDLEHPITQARSKLYVFVEPEVPKKHDSKVLRDIVCDVCGLEKR